MPKKDDPDSTKFDTALERCKANNAHLAVLDTKAKLDHLQKNKILDGLGNKR